MSYLLNQTDDLNVTIEHVCAWNRTEPFTAVDYINVTLRLSTGVVAFLGSCLILVVFLKYPALRNQEKLYFLVVLAVGDALTGFGTTLTSAYQLAMNIPGTKSRCWTSAECVIPYVPFFIGFFLSQLVTTCIAYDRLWAVRKPVEYSTMDYPRYVLRRSLAAGLYAILTACLVLVKADLTSDLSTIPVTTVCDPLKYSTKAFSLYLIGFIAINGNLVVCLYIAAGVVTKRKLAPAESGQGRGARNRQAQNAADSAKITALLRLILLAYICIYLVPSALILLLRAILPSHIFEIVLNFDGLSIFINAGVNAFLYGFKHQDFRKHFKMFFGCFREESNTLTRGALHTSTRDVTSNVAASKV